MRAGGGRTQQRRNTGEIDWNGLRLVVAHDPVTALAQHQKRLVKPESLAAGWAGMLDGQEQSAKKKGLKLSDGGTKARFYRAVCDAHFAHIIKVDLKAELFSYAIDEKALAPALAQMMDGKLLVVTNVRDIDAAQVIGRNNSLADTERGFKVLKSELEIGPVYHRLPERIQQHRVSINGATPLSEGSSMTPEHNEMLKALRIKRPVKHSNFTCCRGTLQTSSQ